MTCFEIILSTYLNDMYGQWSKLVWLINWSKSSTISIALSNHSNLLVPNVDGKKSMKNFNRKNWKKKMLQLKQRLHVILFCSIQQNNHLKTYLLATHFSPNLSMNPMINLYSIHSFIHSINILCILPPSILQLNRKWTETILAHGPDCRLNSKATMSLPGKWRLAFAGQRHKVTSDANFDPACTKQDSLKIETNEIFPLK